MMQARNVYEYFIIFFCAETENLRFFCVDASPPYDLIYRYHVLQHHPINQMS